MRAARCRQRSVGAAASIRRVYLVWLGAEHLGDLFSHDIAQELAGSVGGTGPGFDGAAEDDDARR